MKKVFSVISGPFVWAGRGFASAKPSYKVLIFLSFVIGTVFILNKFGVINIDTLILGEKKIVSVIEQNRKDSLRRVDSIENARAQFAKAQKKAEADSLAAQEARKALTTPVAVSKRPTQPITWTTVFNDSFFWVAAMLLLAGVIITAFYSGKKPTGLMSGAFALSGKFMVYGGVLYLVCFAFYMRDQKVQKIPFYADDSRIRWAIDSTAMANPKQVVYAPDTASLRVIDSLTNELFAYQRDNAMVQMEQAKTIDSLMVIISDQPIEEPVVSKPKEVEKKAVVPAEEKKKDPVVVKKKKKSSPRVAVRDTKTKVYAPGSSGLSRSVQ